jgi:predicted dithiol-disulfide oxidoreductase (DUF899 family)
MVQFTRRQTLAGAAGFAGMIGLGVRPAAAAAAELSAHEQALYEKAKPEGELTWYSGQLNAETSEAVGRAFTERFPGVKVNVVRSTSQVAFQRLSQDTRDGTIRHFWSAEIFGVASDPGQDPRGAPDLDPLWTLLDDTPEGRGTDWYPKLSYGG